MIKRLPADIDPEQHPIPFFVPMYEYLKVGIVKDGLGARIVGYALHPAYREFEPILTAYADLVNSGHKIQIHTNRVKWSAMDIAWLPTATMVLLPGIATLLMGLEIFGVI